MRNVWIFRKENAGMVATEKLTALKVKANLIADKYVGILEIDVDYHDGIALLTGEVDTYEQKYLAEELAYEVEDVFEVVNEIHVVSSAMQNAVLCSENKPCVSYAYQMPTKEDIINRLAGIDGFDVRSINLQLKGNLVCVKGNVKTSEQKCKLQNAILSTSGVIGINSELAVTG